MRALFFLCLCLSFPFLSLADQQVTLTGSSTLAPLALEIAKRFERDYPGIRIDVQTGGSSRGIADVLNDRVDIGMSSRALHDQEQAAAQEYVVALDGVAFVVHAGNPIEGLSSKQARKILTGEIRNWKEVGGRDGKITVIARAKGRSEHEIVTKFLGINPVKIKAAAIGGENQQCVKIIAGNPTAITYLSIGTAEYEIGLGTPLKLLKLDGVPASSRAVMQREFSLVRPLIFVTKQNLKDAAREYLAFALSPQVSDLVQDHAFAPVR